MIDAPYFHVVFTLPHELNPLIYCNQRLLYGLLHKCTAATLLELSQNKKLNFSKGCKDLRNSYNWKDFRDSLYKKDWCPYIKETFNGFGNAIEYLGRYTNKIAISNSRIVSITDTKTTFSARGKKPGEPRRQITLGNEEFIRRYLMHVLPSGFQKIRYYGFLNNRMRSANLKLIFTLQGHQRFKSQYTNMTTAEIIKAFWHVDIHRCPLCGKSSMYSIGRTFSADG